MKCRAPAGRRLPRPPVRHTRLALALVLAACGGCDDFGERLGFGSPPPFASDAESFAWFVGTWSGEGPEGPATVTICDYSASGDDLIHREAAVNGRVRLPDGRVAAVGGTARVVHAEPPNSRDDIYSFRLETAPDGSPSFLRAEMGPKTTWLQDSTTLTLTLGGSYAIGWGEGGAPPAGAEAGPFEGWVEWRDISFKRTTAEPSCPPL